LKIFTAIVCVIFVGITPSYCQSNSFIIGLAGGIGSTYMYGNELYKQKQSPTLGYSVNFKIEQCFRNRFSVLIPIGFEKKGSVSKNSLPFPDGSPGGYANFHFNYTYLTFPLLFKGLIGNKVQGFLEMGPMFGYLLSQETILRSNVLKMDNQSMTNNFRRLDIGLIVGVGSSVSLSKRFKVGLNYRSNLGLKSLNLFTLENNGKVKTASHLFSLFLDYSLFYW
jgi:hypothetical protein